MKILAEYNKKKCYVVNILKDNWDSLYCVLVCDNEFICAPSNLVKVTDEQFNTK